MSICLKFFAHVDHLTNKFSFSLLMLFVFVIGFLMGNYYFETKYLVGFSLLFMTKGISELIFGTKKVKSFSFLFTYVILYSLLCYIFIIK